VTLSIRPLLEAGLYCDVLLLFHRGRAQAALIARHQKREGTHMAIEAADLVLPSYV
jgi:hypothetical protein